MKTVSLQCESACDVLKSQDFENDLSQIKHENGFSPVWIRMWLFKALDFENVLSQIEHKNGFFPVWIRMWRFSMPTIFLLPK